MALYLTEYGGYAAGRPEKVGVPTEPQIQNTVYSSGSGTSTGLLSSGTRLVRLFNDTAINVWILFTGSSVSTSIVTSTGMKISGTPEYRYVQPGSRYTILST